MFGCVIETFLRWSQVSGIQKRFAQLTIGECQPLLIADDAMGIEGSGKVVRGCLPLSPASLLHPEIVVEDAERPVIVQGGEEIEGFEVVGARLLRCVGSDVEVAEVHECMGDGLLIPLRALDREDFPVAGFRLIEIAREGADVAQVAERVGELALVCAQAIICEGLFVGRFGLGELAAMEKDAGAMFVIVGHFFVKRCSYLVARIS